jgi:D-beta-D-heptose 7-phosphate kinase/D-beta-D-heptose 1-phosphate adenosyltransferase
MIISLEEFRKLRETELKDKKIVCTSGYFDPIHPGHITSIMESKQFGEILVVVINGDMQCITKKGKPFMPAKDRVYQVDGIKGVDYAIIYDHPSRLDCTEALEIIKPAVFTKGGDRDDSKKVPEFEIVEKYGGRVQFGVGLPKIWASSNYLKEWEAFVKNKS